MASSVAPVPKSLLKMARNNERKMREKKQNNLTRKLRQIRNNAEKKERVEKEFAKLQARLNALKPSLAKEEYVLVKKSDLKGYKPPVRSTLKRMTKKVRKALTGKSFN